MFYINSGSDPKGLEEELLECFKINVIGQIHLFNLFIPLILKGKAKKVVAMSSSHADLDSINRFQIATSSVYAISKAANHISPNLIRDQT